MIEFLVKNVIRYRTALSIVLIVTTLFFSFFITKIHVDNDSIKAIPPSLKEKIEYDKLKEVFSASFSVLFLAEFSSGTLTEKLDSLRSWEAQLNKLEGIEKISDLNMVQIPVKGGFLGVNSDYLISRKQVLNTEELRIRIQENKEFSQLFISDDETVLGMIIALTSDVNRSKLFKNIITFSENINKSNHIKTYFTTEVAVSYFIDLSMKRDFSILLPICFLVISLLLFRIFRKIRYVIAALLVNVCALIWTFGIMGIVGAPFSVITAIIPVILFPIGVADAIHILKTYSVKILRYEGNVKCALVAAYKEQITPCLLTSLTTFAGFASFTLSPILWMKIFGVFTGIAVIFAYIFNIILLPLFLSYEKMPVISAPVIDAPEDRYISKFWNYVEKISISSNRWVILFPFMIIIFILGFRNVHVESNPVAMLPENNVLRKSDKFIEQHFGGTRFFSAVLTPNGGKLDLPADWKTVNEISSYIESIPGVGNVTSIIPLISKISMMLSGEKISRPALSMLTSTKSLFGKNYTSYINTFLDNNRSSTRISIACKNDPSIKSIDIASKIESYVKDSCSGWSVIVSGPAVLTEAMSLVLIKTQITSLITTFLPVVLCLICFFRSIRTGIFAIIPIVLATAFVYASMGILGVTINLVTVIIMNTCIGIGIDYSIHFISGFIFASKNNNNKIDVLKETIRSKGTPILFNTMIVGVGFLILFFSGFPPVRDFGILVFISMFVSAFFSILILTVLIRFFGIGKIRQRKEFNLVK